MISQEYINNLVQELFENIEFSKNPQGLYEPLRYIIKLGGKRLRPNLCLLCYSIFKHNQEDLNKSILEPAIGLEIFHNFTLIHDDIMDKSELRRGKETVWKKWGEDTAILSGDVMCIEAYTRVIQAPTEVLKEVLDLFTQTTSQVCEGQQYDKDFESQDYVSLEAYTNMIGLKTAVLLACSAKIGGILAETSTQNKESLYNYGYNLGLAFQIADDYLDAFGDEKIFGKPIGGDIINNKKTWLTIKALELADSETKQQLILGYNLPASTKEEKEYKIRFIVDIYKKLDIEKHCQLEIKRLNDIALNYAKQICEGQEYLKLKNFAEMLIGRKK